MDVIIIFLNLFGCVGPFYDLHFFCRIHENQNSQACQWVMMPEGYKIYAGFDPICRQTMMMHRVVDTNDPKIVKIVWNLGNAPATGNKCGGSGDTKVGNVWQHVALYVPFHTEIELLGRKADPIRSTVASCSLDNLVPNGPIGFMCSVFLAQPWPVTSFVEAAGLLFTLPPGAVI